MRAGCMLGLAFVLALPAMREAWAGEAADVVVEAVARPRHDLRLAFTTPGRLEQVLVRAGDRVEAGQPLLILDDAGAEHNLRMLESRAQSDLEVKSAEAEWQMAIIDHQKVEEAFRRNAAAQFEVDRAKLAADQAKLRLEFQQQRKREAAFEHQQAVEAHEQRTLRAPIAGVVEDVVVEQGETVEALRPVVRLVEVDPLWTDAAAPIGATLGLRPGDPAWVRFADRAEDATGTTGAWMASRVVSLALVADAASGTRLVRVETPNAAGTPAGRVVQVRFSDPNPARSEADDRGPR